MKKTTVLRIALTALAVLLLFTCVCCNSSGLPGGETSRQTDDSSYVLPETAVPPAEPDSSEEAPDTAAPPDTAAQDESTAEVGDETASPDTQPETSVFDEESSAPEETSAPEVSPATETEAPPTPSPETEPETAAPDEDKRVPVEKIILTCPLKTVRTGGSAYVTATVLPENATDKRISWGLSCSASKAIINTSGRVTGRTKGDITVYATAADGSKVQATLKLTVTDCDVTVGISYMGQSVSLSYYKDAVKKAGCEPVVLPLITSGAEAIEALSGLDALIMTGGEDIDPSEYGEKKLNNSLVIDSQRDTSDILLVRAALEADIPMLCICRGMQVLNVVQGGTLYQDIPVQLPDAAVHRDPSKSRYVFHKITVTDGSELSKILGACTATVSSWHHQSLKDIGEGLTVTAKSPDGIVEAVEMASKRYVIGVQFHPEKQVALGQPTFLAFFERLREEGTAYASLQNR